MLQEEVRDRLEAFVQSHRDPSARVTAIEAGPGHAGFSYLFDVQIADIRERYYLRLPPPGVAWEGPADMHRHVTALRALDGTTVPHAGVVWDGDDLRWFGSPYYIVDRIDGITYADPASISAADPGHLTYAAQQAMTALAAIHRIDPAGCAYLGAFAGLEHEITRWDRFAERAADRDVLLQRQPDVRAKLLATMPVDVEIGLYHGDYQFQNLMYRENDGELLAVIDWELASIGPTLNDVGWIAAFHDRPAWGEVRRPSTAFADAPDLVEWYCAARGESLEHITWFESLSLYKYAIITGFNLMLHRRGKRVDDVWEYRAPGAVTNLEHALALLGAP